MDGLLLIDKPVGCTSHDIVDRVRRVLHIRAVGHAGTLDPFASGLLILGIGKGTKALTALVGTDKRYEAIVKLGASTDTYDREGKITATWDAASEPPTLKQIEEILPRFTGTFNQLAPIYSAKKHLGVPLYKLARAGTATEDLRPTKEITVRSLTIRSYAWPDLQIDVECSSGTYIRSLANDIGDALGVGGYADQLRRTMVGTYHVEQAISGDKLTAEGIQSTLIAL